MSANVQRRTSVWVAAATLLFCTCQLISTGCGDPTFAESLFAQHSIEDSGGTLECVLQPVSKNDSVVGVRTYVRNVSSTTVRLLRWDTPWDADGDGDAFHVVDIESGEEIRHRSPAVRLGLLPPESAYLPLEPGESISTVSPLMRDYPVGARRARVSLRTHRWHLRTMEHQRDRLANANCGHLTVVGEAQSGAVGVQRSALSPHPDCTPAQQADFRRTIHAAKRIVRHVLRMNNDVNDRPSEALERLNQRWFGVVTPSNTASGLTDTWRRIASSDATVRCGGHGCSGALGVVADYWLFGGKKLRLCPSLVSYPVTSVKGKSKAGTLIHELAHYEGSPFGTIQDWQNPGCDRPESRCYGYDNCLYLASCHLCARRNADSYKYFAMEAHRDTVFAAILPSTLAH
jgi:hypothetical protein